VTLEAPWDRSRQSVVLVVEVDDARAEHERLRGLGVQFLADPYEPPPSFRPGVVGFAGDASSPGGCRFCCGDPDSYLRALNFAKAQVTGFTTCRGAPARDRR
jgi:hypothetical protein